LWKNVCVSHFSAILLTSGQSNLTKGHIAEHSNSANIYNAKQLIKTMSNLHDVIRHHYYLHATICEIRHFKLLFCINANVYLQTNYTHRAKCCLQVCILYSLYSHFWRSHCYNAFFIGEQLPKLPLHLENPNMWFLGPTQVFIRSCMSIGSSIFLQLTGESAYTGWPQKSCTSLNHYISMQPFKIK